MYLLRIVTMLCIACTFLQACKKDEEAPELSGETKQFNDDSNTFKAESDQADNDVTAALQDIPAFGRLANIAVTPVCGMTVDTTQVSQKIVYLNFDSTIACLTPARSRSGQIRVELTQGNYWRDAGSELTLTYIQYKVTRLSTGKSITFNGTKKLTNINGNNWMGFLAGTDTLKYKSRAFNLQVRFNSGLTASWNVAYLSEWHYRPVPQEVVFTASGDTIMVGNNRTASWGSNRYHQDFITVFNKPIVSNTSCGLGRPTHGDLTHKFNNSRFDIVLGVDQNGNAANGCPYGFLVYWYYDETEVASAVFSY